MRWLSRLSFVRQAPFAPVYVVDEGVYTATTTLGQFRQVGSLDADAAAINHFMRIETANRNGGDPRYWLANLRFCLSQLLPTVRAIEDRATSPYGFPVELKAEIGRLTEGLDLPPVTVPTPAPPVVTGGMLATWLGTPCAILQSTAVVPLERADDPDSMEETLVIGDIPYRQSLHSSRRIRDVLVAMCGEVNRLLAGGLSYRDHFPHTESDPESYVRPLLRRLHAVNSGSHWVIHAGPEYQLHYGGGRFFVFRGPFARRNDRKLMYVAVEIQGPTRADQLAVVPRRTDSPEAHWALGGAGSSLLCMGPRIQYQHLMSPGHSDAAALLLFLDAAADIAAGRSELHREWRLQRCGPLGFRDTGIQRRPSRRVRILGRFSGLII